MPAVRLSRRRKSSIYSPARPGVYGVPARPVTFAPNVTPVSYTEIDEEDPLASIALAAADASAGPNVRALTAKLFPPAETPAQPPTRKRCPPGKRRSQGYIPRPPNAFMLFRADFVKQKHVPGAIETNHGSLSKIIGNCWRELPQSEKHIWEVKARQEKAAHKAMHPDYRFRPVHNKNKQVAKTAAKAKQPTSADEERRCEEVAQLLLQGKKGEELARAVRSLDRERSRERELELETLGLDGEYELGLESRRSSYGYAGSHHGSQRGSPTTPLHAPASLHLPFGMNSGFPAQSSSSSMGMNAGYHRRSSSVPLPNGWFNSSDPYVGSSTGGITLPSVPSFVSRPASPVGSISRFNQGQKGQFTNPFQRQEAMPQQQFATVSPSAQFFPSQTPQQTLFHPLSFTHQTSPRSSLGLGHRRASSAQPFLRRSWTMPMSNYDFGMGMDMPMERDHSPLPDVAPEFFADFSFGNNGSNQQSTTAPSVAASAGTIEEAVDPASPRHPATSPSSPLMIDTSIPPLSRLPETSSQSTSASTSSLGSPSPSIDLNMNSFVHLDNLYAPESTMGMYEHDQYGAIDMGGMYGYDLDPVVPSQTMEQDGYLHAPKPMRTPTEANFGQDMEGDGAAYFESE